MKRALSMMLVLALGLLGFAMAEAVDLTGVWYLNIVETEGMQLDPAMIGMEMTLSLNADGSAEMDNGGETEAGWSWTNVDGVAQIADASGVAFAARLDGGNMVIANPDAGITMIFGQEKQALQLYVPAAVEESPALSDFEGSWNAALIDMMGMQVSMDAIGMQLVVEIAGETAKVTSNEDGAELRYEAPVTLEGNTLTVAAVDDQMPMTLRLQQDGKIVFAEESDGMAITMYFEKIA